MPENGSKTILHRGFTESIKKYTEDNKHKAHRKHRHSIVRRWLIIEERQVTGRNTG